VDPRFCVAFNSIMVMLVASTLAACGGILWGFGILGKRLGVHGAREHDKEIRATYTIFVYTLTTMIAPTIDFVRLAVVESELLRETFSNHDWNVRIPGVIACGVISGLGGLLGTIAFAWSAGANSALLSVVENGMYTLSAAILIAVLFQEHPGILQYVAGIMIMAGITLASVTPSPVEVEAEGEDDSNDSIPSGPHGPGAVKKGDYGSSMSASSEAYGLESATDSEVEVTGFIEATTPTPRLRKSAAAMAVLAGVCWGFGPLGKKYGVAGAPQGKKHAWSICCYLIYISSTPIVAIGKLAWTPSEQRKEVLREKRFLMMLAATMICGVLSGLGGLVSTMAFAYADQHSALVSMIENGVFTVSGAIFIMAFFKETLTMRQSVSAMLVAAGLVISAAT